MHAGFSLVAVLGLLIAVVSLVVAPGSRAQAQQLWHMGSVVRGMWDPLGSGIEPVSPALQADAISEPPGKPHQKLFWTMCRIVNDHQRHAE